MGEGECAGEITRGLPCCGAPSEELCECCGALFCGIGELCAPIEPKLMGGRPVCPTGPPFGVYPVAPEALMTIEGFRPCSDVPFVLADEETPCAMVPFTGASAAALAALCVGAEAPAGGGGVFVAVVVVLAERAGGWAGGAPEKGVEVPEGALEALKWCGG